MPETSTAIEVCAETDLPRRGRRRSIDDVNTAATAMFSRLDAVGTGYIHEDQVQWLHMEGAPESFQSSRQDRSTQVSLVEWQSLVAALCSVVGSKRLKSSLRTADVIVSKGQMTSVTLTPLQSSVTLPFVSNLWDLKPAVAAPPPGPKPLRIDMGPKAKKLTVSVEEPVTDHVVIVSPKRSDDELRHLSEELSQADTEVVAVLQDNLEEQSTDELVKDAESLLHEVSLEAEAREGGDVTPTETTPQ
eukprot:symbB.v1.2.038816.t1/scaffold6101.1/size20926/1